MDYKGPFLTLDFVVRLIFGTADGWLALAVLGLALIALWLLLLFGRTLRLRAKLLSIPGFFLAVYLMVMSVPSTIFFADKVTAFRWPYLLSVQLFPLFFLAGMFVALLIIRSLRPRPVAIANVTRPPTPVSRSGPRHLRLLKWMFLASILATAAIGLIYVLTMEQVPLFVFISGKHKEIEGGARFIAYEAPSHLIFFHALGVRIFVPIAVMSSFLLFKLGHRKWFNWFVVAFIIGLFFSLLTLERQGPIALFAFLALGNLLIDGIRRFWKPFIVCVGAAGFFGIVVTSGQFGDASQSAFDQSAASVGIQLVRFFVMRVIIDPAYMAYAVMELYADRALLFGSNIKLLKPLFESLGSHYEGLTAIGIVPDFWINFGGLGIGLGGLSLGFCLQFFESALLQQNSVVSVIFKIILMVCAIWLLYSNIFPIMVTCVYALLGCCLLLIRSLHTSTKVQSAINSS